MVMTNVPPLIIPDMRFLDNSAPNTFAISGSGHYYAAIVPVPKSGNIRKVGFIISSISSSQTLKAEIQTLSSGLPSGTLYGGSAKGTGTPSVGANEITLGTDAAATAGNEIAVVIQFDSTVGNVTFKNRMPSSTYRIGRPYAVENTASATKREGWPIIWLVYDDGSYAVIPGTAPITGMNTGASATNRSLKFQLPIKTRLIGVWTQCGPGFSTATVLTPKLYAADGSTLLATGSAVDRNEPSTTAMIYHYLAFPPTTLNANTEYYLMIDTGGSGTPQPYVTFTSAAVMAAWGGSLIRSATGAAGALTEQALDRPMTYLVLDQIDIPAPGGLLLHPGMSGGMRA